MRFQHTTFGYPYTTHFERELQRSLMDILNIPRTNVRNEICPTGYTFYYNIAYRDVFAHKNPYKKYLLIIRKLRSIHRDIYVGDAYDEHNRKLENTLAIYVMHKPRKFKANRIRKYMPLK